MAVISKSDLKKLFETGDIPTESNFTDLIDTLETRVDVKSATISGSGDVWDDFNSYATIVYKQQELYIITHFGISYILTVPNPDTYGAGGTSVTSSNFIQLSYTVDEIDTKLKSASFGIKYAWDTQVEQDAQTGMIADELGVRRDTRDVYKYTGSLWIFFFNLGASNQDLINHTTDIIDPHSTVRDDLSVSTTYTWSISKIIENATPSVDSMASLRAVTNASLGQPISTLDYYSDISGGGNSFKCTAANYVDHPNYIPSEDLATFKAREDNDGFFIVTDAGAVLEALESDIVSDLRIFGAKANDNTFNNSVIIQKIIDIGLSIDIKIDTNIYYVSGGSELYFILIDETKSGLYINFGESTLKIKYDGIFLNSRCVLRYTGGSLRPNFNVGKVRIVGEFDYDYYNSQLDAEFEAQSAPSTTGIGRFLADRGASATALTNFHITHETYLKNLNSTIIEGVQFLGEFNNINIAKIETEYMTGESFRFNGTNNSLCNIGTVKIEKSFGSAFTANSNSTLSSTEKGMILNIENVIIENSESGFDLTATVKTEVGADSYCIANFNNVYIKNTTYITKIHGAWDYNFNNFTAIDPHEWLAISYSALWLPYDYLINQNIGFMKVDGYIGTSAIENDGIYSNTVLVNVLNVQNTYYVTSGNSTYENIVSRNVKDLFRKDSINVYISNIDYKVEEGIDYTTMFGGRYTTAQQNLYINNIEINKGIVRNIFSFINKPNYFIYYKGGVTPDLDTDNIRLNNITFIEDTDDINNKPLYFIGVIKGKGYNEFNNINFIRGGAIKTDINFIRILDSTIIYYSNLTNISQVNHFSGVGGEIVIGNGTFKKNGAYYNWKHDGDFYENTVIPSTNIDGTIIKKADSLINPDPIVATGATPTKAEFDAIVEQYLELKANLIISKQLKS